MFNTATLRGRLTLAYAVALVIALTIFAGATLVAFDSVQHRLLDTELSAVAAGEASSLELGPDGTIDASDRRRFASLAGRHVQSAVILPGGRTLVASIVRTPEVIAHAAAGGQHTVTTTLDDEGDHIRATFVPVMSAGKLAATIAVWSDVETIATLDTRLALVFATAIPLSGLLATLAGRIIAGRGLAPLETMIGDASRIEAHDVQARVALPRTTELARLAATLNAMLQRLNDAFDRERRFTSDASHELRAPLSIIIAESDLALSTQRSASDYRRALETIAIEADGLEALTRDLLASARSTRADTPLARPVDLAEVVGSVVGRVRNLLRERDLTIDETSTEGAIVIGDADRIERVVLTLVHNAIRYAREHGRIEIDVVARDAAIELSVADDGPGFSEEALEHAFERFWSECARADGDRGHGLGLTIARTSIELAGGSVVLRNRADGGAIVIVSLPKAP